MARQVDATHDRNLESWVASAQKEEADFPVQNLPFGVFRHQTRDKHIGVAIGDQILDLYRAEGQGLLSELSPVLRAAVRAGRLNELMALEPDSWSALRGLVSRLLTDQSAIGLVRPCLVAQVDVRMQLPAEIGDYTDFYASIEHATNIGRLFRPENPLLPNYRYVPIAYHGRSSSITLEPSIQRPSGQRKMPEESAPTFGPCRALDYELEVGFFVGGADNPLGEPVPLAEAEDRIFGLCLVNDWSARDLQAWEYQPLGPFLAKSFATTLSPWIVTLDALAPFRCPARAREDDEPQPLGYLSEGLQADSGFDLTLEVWLETEKMRSESRGEHRLSRGHFRKMYWTLSQMLTHHASNGCPLRAGDLIASGTVSGPTMEERGSLLEITTRGAEPVDLGHGESRGLLEDLDEVILRGFCDREGFRRIGFGECRGRVAPALA